MTTGKPFFTFKQFIYRRETIKLYRDFLRALKGVENLEKQLELRTWIRGEFEMWKHNHEEEMAQILLSKGQTALRELQTSIELKK